MGDLPFAVGDSSSSSSPSLVGGLPSSHAGGSSSVGGDVVPPYEEGGGEATHGERVTTHRGSGGTRRKAKFASHPFWLVSTFLLTAPFHPSLLGGTPLLSFGVHPKFT